ncbi:hypothetical protein CSA17_00325 [bacterium DOLJORAL78_65_58]|nr:MAG: hypothetical protein CSA17_00325 [bacterium DOLJORAL78_65_58]
MITDAAMDDDGAIYLADWSLGDLKVFDTMGSYQRTLSRRGEGPGETENPNDVILGRPGAVGIMQRVLPRLIWIDAVSGDPLGSLEPKRPDGQPLELAVFFGAVVKGERTAVGLCPVEITSEALVEVPQVVVFDDDGREIDYYYKSQPELQTNDDSCPTYRWLNRRWALDDSDHLYLTPERDRYLVVCYALGGKKIWSTERDYRAPIRDARTLDKMQALRKRHNMIQQEDCDRPSVFRSLHWDGNDRIWVELNQAMPERGVLGCYDLLACSDGTYLKQVILKGEFDPDRDRAFWLGGGRFLVIRINDDGEQILHLLEGATDL